MRLKKLEIHGFKSFADRAVLLFGDGVTGVVGPNGCGKSNVVDALRWCMGEMSAKHLRGRAMQDVIFAGTDSRGPQGLAEVTLTFENDGNVPANFASYAEIAVTRRLHRSGQSEYLINRQPSRLRDVTELFLGTGLGSNAYSIIEQGRIGFIVNSRPEDRRVLIEEVAGITKYKLRKKTAERRMAATEQNLERVNDILRELERQLESLRRQARKAERYKEMSAKLRDLELHQAVVDLLRVMVMGRSLSAQESSLQRERDDQQRELAASEASLEAQKLQLLEDERKVQLEQALLAQVESRLAASERDLEHWRTQLDDGRRRGEEAQKESEDAQTRVHELGEERERLAAEAATWVDRSQDEEDRLAEAQERVGLAQERLAQTESELEETRNKALAVIQRFAEARAQVSRLEEHRASHQTRRLVLAEEASNLEDEIAVGVDAQGQAHSQIADLDGKLCETQNQLEAHRKARGDLEEACALGRTALRDLDALLTERRSRLNSLEEIARQLEGYSDGVRALLGKAEDGQEDGQGFAAVRGLFPDLLEMDPKYETAIESVLGDRMQYVLVDGPSEAQDGLAFLTEHKAGRGGFVPLASGLPEASCETSLMGATAALNCVRLGAAGQDLSGAWEAVSRLLASVWVVDDLAAATAVWPEAQQKGQTLVTCAGEVFEPWGALVGGAGGGTGLLSKQREIRELGLEVAKLDARKQEDAQVLAGQEAEVASLREQEQHLDASQRSFERQKMEAQKDEEVAGSTVLRLRERQQNVEDEVAACDDKLFEMSDALKQAEGQAEDVGGDQSRLEDALNTLQERRQLEALVLEDVQAEERKCAMESAERQQKLTSRQDVLQRLEEASKDLHHRLDRSQRQVRESDDVAARLAAQIENGSQEVARLAEDAQKRKETYGKLKADHDEARDAATALEDTLRGGRRALETLQSSLTSVAMEMQRLELERSHILAQVETRHDLDLNQVVTDFHTRPAPAEEDKQRMLDLERSIRNLGPINLTAIQECAEVEERFGFLSKQQEDLTEALEALRRAIGRINRASRERFREAFALVDSMFQKVYPRLFRGGAARLELLEAEDVLDSGVDIVAMPPGKKLQNVTLLSGGEKALTATALIFAIFLIKPSPFCVLDEVDAPLDEANVRRFNDMLQEMSELSQFVVITHNKRTMEVADRLYGITMEDAGQSKVVSVDLRRFAVGDAAEAQSAA